MGIKIHGMRLGGFPVPLDMLFDAGGVRTTQRLDDGDIVNGLYQCPSLSYIIEHPDAGLIAFETGVSTNWNEEWLSDWTDLVDLSGITPEVCIEAQLRTRGWGPEDFGHVIQGHLHADHAGGLRVFEEAGATIVVHEDEWRYCVSNIADADLFFIRADWNFVSRAPQMLVYGDQEIFQDVWTISLPGHTPGQMGLLVRLDLNGWVLLTSDAMYFHDTIGEPNATSVVNMLPEDWNNSIAKIAQIAADRDAFLLPGHDLVGSQYTEGVAEAKRIDFAPGAVYE